MILKPRVFSIIIVAVVLLEQANGMQPTQQASTDHNVHTAPPAPNTQSGSTQEKDATALFKELGSKTMQWIQNHDPRKKVQQTSQVQEPSDDIMKIIQKLVEKCTTKGNCKDFFDKSQAKTKQGLESLANWLKDPDNREKVMKILKKIPRVAISAIKFFSGESGGSGEGEGEGDYSEE